MAQWLDSQGPPRASLHASSALPGTASLKGYTGAGGCYYHFYCGGKKTTPQNQFSQRLR